MRDEESSKWSLHAGESGKLVAARAGRLEASAVPGRFMRLTGFHQFCKAEEDGSQWQGKVAAACRYVEMDAQARAKVGHEKQPRFSSDLFVSGPPEIVLPTLGKVFSFR